MPATATVTTAQASTPVTMALSTADWIAVVAAVIAVLSMIAAVLSMIAACRQTQIAQRALTLQALMSLQTEYRSSEMLYAIDTLRNFAEPYGGKQEALGFAYLTTTRQELGRICALDAGERVQAYRESLHAQRRLVSQFYQQLAAAFHTRAIPEDLLASAWTREDLKIISDIVVPIENTMRQERGEGSLREDSALVRLFRASERWNN